MILDIHKQVSPKAGSRPSNPARWQRAWLPLVVSSFFIALLALWFYVDHSLPLHDASWHSLFGSQIKQWLCRPKNWTFEGFCSLLTLQRMYPAGVWFIDGALKVVVGDSECSERIVLLLRAVALNLVFWRLALTVWQDRQKALLGLIVLNCFPLTAALEHVSFLDLPHAILFALFLYTALRWRRNPTWKNAVVCGLSFGLDCISKQIAILYALPCLIYQAVISAKNGKFTQVKQLMLIGGFGALFLSSWVIPNLARLLQYSHIRSTSSVCRVNFIDSVFGNLTLSIWQIVQSISPLGLACILLCLPWLKRQDLKQGDYPLVGAFCGWFLIAVVAYYNVPEPRYFSPILIVAALYLGAGLAKVFQSGRRLFQGLAVCALGLMVVQLVALSFSSAPLILRPIPQDVNQVFKLAGISESQIVSIMPAQWRQDAWKQRWLIKTIVANEELTRVCLVNVLPNTLEYNQGTLTYLAKHLNSPVSFTTYRRCMADMSDKLEFSEDNLRMADWHILKTGYQGGKFFDEVSQRNYEKTLVALQHPNRFKLVAQTELPDGSNLLLYHTNHMYQIGWTK